MFKLLKNLVFKFFETLYKCKFKAMYLYFTDPTYHNQIMTIQKIKSKVVGKSEKCYIPLDKLRQSHFTVYFNWVGTLIGRLSQHRELKYLDVVVMEDGSYFLIDGNHKLAAYRYFYGSNSNKTVLCKVFKLESK